MHFRIPHAPRPVRLRQIPGAVRRLLVAAALSFLVLVTLAAVARLAADRYVRERTFLRDAAEVTGVVAGVRLPRLDDEGATVDVLYDFDGTSHTASRLPLSTEDAKTLRQGMTLELLVDPAAPDRAREARWARAEAAALDGLPYGLAAGGVIALLWMGWVLLQTLRSDLQPLRRGLLVWLTPEGPLPQTRREIVFPASYYRDDVQYRVKARIRPGRAPVRNGEKLLAAVVPSRPKWARVVDEELARALGWWG